MYLPNQRRCTQIDFRLQFQRKGGLLRHWSVEWTNNSRDEDTMDGECFDPLLKPSQHDFWWLERRHGGHSGMQHT